MYNNVHNYYVCVKGVFVKNKHIIVKPIHSSLRSQSERYIRYTQTNTFIEVHVSYYISY